MEWIERIRREVAVTGAPPLHIVAVPGGRTAQVQQDHMIAMVAETIIIVVTRTTKTDIETGIANPSVVGGRVSGQDGIATATRIDLGEIDTAGEIERTHGATEGGQ